MSASKKIFVASFSIFIAVVLFWGIYVISFKKDVSLPVDTTLVGTGSSSTGEIGEIFSGTVLKNITDEEVLAPTLSENSTYIKYYSKAGQAYRIDFEGKNKQLISSQTKAGFLDAFWSPGKTRVIHKTSGNGAQAMYSVFNYQTNQESPLKENIDSIYWQNDARIFYKYYDANTKERSLNIADADGANWKKLTALTLRDIRLAPIPKTGFVSYWNKADANTETNLFSVSTVSGESKMIFKGKFGADYLWNNSGTKTLMSYTDTKNSSKINLATIDDSGENFQDLGIPTFAHKCVWATDNKTIYYALPSGISETASLPNDYWAKKLGVADTFWKINTETGNKKRLIDLEKIETKIDAKNLFLNDDESVLFFVNDYDGKLYSLKL